MTRLPFGSGVHNRQRSSQTTRRIQGILHVAGYILGPWISKPGPYASPHRELEQQLLTRSVTDYPSLCELIIGLSRSNGLCRVSQQTPSKLVNRAHIQLIHDCLWLGHWSLVQSAGAKVSRLVSLREYSSNLMQERTGLGHSFQKGGLQGWHKLCALLSPFPRCFMLFDQILPTLVKSMKKNAL